MRGGSTSGDEPSFAKVRACVLGEKNVSLLFWFGVIVTRSRGEREMSLGLKDSCG